MKPMDLSELVKGLMVVIGIALALGKMPELKQWAIERAFRPRPMVEMPVFTPVPKGCNLKKGR